MKNVWTPGTKVMFVEPQDEVEQTLIMTVLEDNVDRVRVEYAVENFDRIIPQSVYLKSDLKAID